MAKQISMRELGEILEYGGAHTRPFPHWRPTFLHFENKYLTIEERWSEKLEEANAEAIEIYNNEENKVETAGESTLETKLRTFEDIFNSLLESKYKQLFKEQEKEIMEEIREEIVNRIMTNFFEYKNDPKYAKWKIKVGGGEVPLVLTGAYVQSIEVVETETGYIVQIADKMHPEFVDASGT